MAQSHVRISYTVELSEREMHLIGLALSGRLKVNSREMMHEALSLNTKLLEQQQMHLNELKSKVDGALNKAIEESDANWKEES